MLQLVAPLLTDLGWRGTALRCVLGLVVAWLVGHTIGWVGGEEPIFYAWHLPMARQLADGLPVTATFPLWGYPALAAVVGADGGVVAQVLGAVAAAELALRLLLETGVAPRIAVGLQLLAVPWWALSAGRWPMVWTGVATVCALTVLVRSGLHWRGVALAGLCFGLGAQFRPEVLALPAAMAVALLLAPQWRTRAPALLVSLAVGMATLVPWGLHYQRVAHEFRLTSSNGGMVGWVSLGQLPNNPWGAQAEDGDATRQLHSTDAGRRVHPLTAAGDALLREEVASAIRQHPLAWLRKLAWNLRSAAIGGLYVGKVAQTDDDAVALDVVKEHAKLWIGLNPNLGEIASYKARGLWNQPRLPWRAALGLAWELAGVALGAGLLTLGSAGAVLLLRRRDAYGQLLGALLVGVVAGHFGLVALLQYQPRHLTPLAVWLGPLAWIALQHRPQHQAQRRQNDV